LAKEENDGWAIVTGVTGLIHASDWMANGGFIRIASDLIMIVLFIISITSTATYPQDDDTQWVSRKKLFFNKGQK
jgi:hypothetical protein